MIQYCHKIATFTVHDIVLLSMSRKSVCEMVAICTDYSTSLLCIHADVNATPSKYLTLIILIIIIPLLIIPVIIWRLCRHSSGMATADQPVFKLSDILAAKAKLRKVDNNILPVSATNPLALDAADT